MCHCSTGLRFPGRAAISLSKDNPALIAEMPCVEAMMDRALALDEAFDYGAIHVYFITYEMGRLGGDR